MKRQIRNVISSLAITVFASFGLLAFGQEVQVQSDQQCVQQTLVNQSVQDFVVQQQQQQATTGCACSDLCEVTRNLRKNASDLRKYFRRSARDNECIDEAYIENVREFHRAARRLRRDFRRDCNACAVAPQVQEVLNLANCISAYMDPCSLCPEATAVWSDLQCDLQTLAGSFGTTACFQQPRSLSPQPAFCPAPSACPTGAVFIK